MVELVSGPNPWAPGGHSSQCSAVYGQGEPLGSQLLLPGNHFTFSPYALPTHHFPSFLSNPNLWVTGFLLLSCFALRQCHTLSFWLAWNLHTPRPECFGFCLWAWLILMGRRHLTKWDIITLNLQDSFPHYPSLFCFIIIKTNNKTQSFFGKAQSTNRGLAHA